MTRGIVVSAIVVAAIAVACYAFMRNPGRSFRGSAPQLDAAAAALQSSLRRDVQMLAGEIGERNVVLDENYARAAIYIENEFRHAGYTTERQTFEVEGIVCANIQAERRGTSSEIIVIGAHYDSVDGSPGADDNAAIRITTPRPTLPRRWITRGSRG